MVVLMFFLFLRFVLSFLVSRRPPPVRSHLAASVSSDDRINDNAL